MLISLENPSLFFTAKKNTEIYTHLINFENDEWQVNHAKTLEEQGKLIDAGFEYVRYSDKDEVAIYRKRK